MHYAGIDLHRRTIVIAIEDENGPVGKTTHFACRDSEAIRLFFENLGNFRAVVEASCGYRWLYDLLSPLGDVVLAHPRRLKAIVDGRAKTDKLDSALLAKLLKADLIPTAYVPPPRYAKLRDLTRGRSQLSRNLTKAKNELHALLARQNIHLPFKTPFCKRWVLAVSRLDFGQVGDIIRDEHLRRIAHYQQELSALDLVLKKVSKSFPEIEALLDIRGVGLYTGLLIIAEIAEPWRFTDGRKVGAYAGLTARVNQSGEHCYHGHITRQGSGWLRWALVQVAMKVPPGDLELNKFYQRIRKRSSAKIARVAVARKLAGICWVRLMNYHRAQAA